MLTIKETAAKRLAVLRKKEPTLLNAIMSHVVKKPPKPKPATSESAAAIRDRQEYERMKEGGVRRDKR
jgi:hypothetical protein